MQTAMGSHIPHASGRILAERFLFVRKVSTECTTFLINKKAVRRFARQMQTAMGSHIPHASGRILAERFLFVRKVSTECTTFLINKKAVRSVLTLKYCEIK